MKNFLKMLLCMLFVVAGVGMTSTNVSAASLGAGSITPGQGVIQMDEKTTEREYDLNDASWITEKPENDIFGEITAMFRNISRSGYVLLMTIGCIVFVLSIIVAAILHAATKDKNRRVELKDWMVNVLFAGVIIGFATTAFGLVMSIGSMLK